MNTGAYKFIGRIVAILAATTVPAFGNPVAGQGTWQTTLQARDLDRNLHRRSVSAHTPEGE